MRISTSDNHHPSEYLELLRTNIIYTRATAWEFSTIVWPRPARPQKLCAPLPPSPLHTAELYHTDGYHHANRLYKLSPDHLISLCYKRRRLINQFNFLHNPYFDQLRNLLHATFIYQDQERNKLRRSQMNQW